MPMSLVANSKLKAQIWPDRIRQQCQRERHEPKHFLADLENWRR